MRDYDRGGWDLKREGQKRLREKNNTCLFSNIESIHNDMHKYTRQISPFERILLWGWQDGLARCLLLDPMIWVLSSESTWQKETNSCKLSSGFHTFPMVSACMHVSPTLMSIFIFISIYTINKCNEIYTVLHLCLTGSLACYFLLCVFILLCYDNTT